MTYYVNVTTTARRPLTREHVVDTAVIYADAHGVDELSMRKLGTELGVEAMALYNHVDNKQDLFNGMIDYVFEEITLADISNPWKEQLRLIGEDAMDKFAAHPWVVTLLTAQGNFGDGALRFMNHVLGILFRAGFGEEDTHHAWGLLASHTMGYAMQSSASIGVHEDKSILEDQLPRLNRELPNVGRVAPFMIDCDWDYEYRLGLEIILDGLEARLG